MKENRDCCSLLSYISFSRFKIKQIYHKGKSGDDCVRKRKRENKQTIRLLVQVKSVLRVTQT